MIRLGLLSFSDGRERVHADLAPDIRAHEQRIHELLEGTGELEVVNYPDIVNNPALAGAAARQMNRNDLDGVIFNIPVFAFPNLVVIAAQLLDLPLLLLGPHDSRYPGLTGLLASGGSLNQVGRLHERLWIDLKDPRFTLEALSFARASRAATRLKGQVYGLVGGRSIGMYTGAAPAERWQSQFGVDVDHVDQLEIIRRAKLVDDAEVAEANDWLTRHVREVVFDPPHFSPEKLDFEMRCYIALKSIVKDYHFDMVGLKCHFDLSEYFSVQCFSAALMNDPYDWAGPKPSIPLACEADSDGALSMQILKLMSKKPSCLLDLRFYDPERGVYVMPNCGSAPTWFAARSDDPAVNLGKVRIVPSIRKYAGGGGHVEFVFGEGPLTLARLGRNPDGYHMVIGRAEAVELPVDQMRGANPGWPHAFLKLDIEPDTLVDTLPANHVHVVDGDYRNELVRFCRMVGIQPVLLPEKAVQKGN